MPARTVNHGCGCRKVELACDPRVGFRVEGLGCRGLGLRAQGWESQGVGFRVEV